MAISVQSATRRLRIRLHGAVQGVGFRPFVYRLASELSLTGWVLNCSAGLVVEVEGPVEQLDQFAQRLERERPAASVISAHESDWLQVEGSTKFFIRTSDTAAGKTAS